MNKNILTLAVAVLLCVGSTQAQQKKKTATKATVINFTAQGELGIFGLKGPVKECIWTTKDQTQKLGFDRNGMWVSKDGQTPWFNYGSVKRDNKGRIIQMGDGEETGELITYNNNGLMIKHVTVYMDGRDIAIYSYNSNGDCTKESFSYGDMYGSGKNNAVFTILSRDSQGNWTKRKTQNGNIETRTITYYEAPKTSSNTNAVTAVDLGLSVKWASCNVGANKPEEIGDYFAWGEVKPKSTFTYANYVYRNTANSKKEDCIDIGTDISGTKYDAAHVIMGGPWRMPTEKELEELFEKCKTVDMENGWKFIGPNGNSIFMPYSWFNKVDNIKDGIYWTGTREWYTTLGESKRKFAVTLYFHHNIEAPLDYRNNASRFEGNTIRAVCSKDAKFTETTPQQTNENDMLTIIENQITTTKQKIQEAPSAENYYLLAETYLLKYQKVSDDTEKIQLLNEADKVYTTIIDKFPNKSEKAIARRGLVAKLIDKDNKTWAAKPYYEKYIKLVEQKANNKTLPEDDVRDYMAACMYMMDYYLANHDQKQTKNYVQKMYVIEPDNENIKKMLDLLK